MNRRANYSIASYDLRMWIERFITPQLMNLASTRPALLVTGARQTGKTSLLRHSFPGYRFVSLDVPSEASQAENDPEVFFARNPPPVIIDEAQYAPRLFRHLKVLIDRDRGARGRFLLTGSQKQQLMDKSAESLAGRIGLLELETLSWRELAGRDKEWTVARHLFRGGYPELAVDRDINVGNFYRAYLSTYLERDVRTLLAVSSLRDFERFVRACALRSGQLLNKAELARDVGIAPSTAGQWLSVLQASNIVLLLEPWFANKTKSLVKSPKLYFADSGLLCYLMDIDEETHLYSSPAYGAIWETYVFGEIRKRQTAAKGHWRCHFWADRNREVDFLIHQGGRFDLYEAKTTANPEMSDARQLLYAMEKLGPENVTRAGIICRAMNSYPLQRSIEAITVDDLMSAV